MNITIHPLPREAPGALAGCLRRAGDGAALSAEGGDHHGDDIDQCLGERGKVRVENGNDS